MMADEPISLAAKRLTPDPDLIATTRRLLAVAESGELRGLAYVTIKPGGFVGTGWEAAAECSNHVLHSGASILYQRIAARMAEQGADTPLAPEPEGG